MEGFSFIQLQNKFFPQYDAEIGTYLIERSYNEISDNKNKT